MMYKAFAAIALLAAPAIVLLAQNVVPPHPTHPGFSLVQPAPPMPPPVVQPATVVPTAVPAITTDLSAAGQPMPEAGKPMLFPTGEMPSDEMDPVQESNAGTTIPISDR